MTTDSMMKKKYMSDFKDLFFIIDILSNFVINMLNTKILS